MKNNSLLICEKDLGQRLDKLLTKHFPDHSRTYFQHLIENKHILVNGKPVKKRETFYVGDNVTISFEEPPELDVKPENIPLDILFEDEHLLVINKPANFVVHPGPGVHNGTFANALLYHCKQLNTEEFIPLRPGIVHRLDKDTTGILIAAKTRTCHQKLTEQFANRSIEKHYLAICSSAPPEGLFSAPIKRHPVNRKTMHVSENGKEAISHFRLLAKKENLSLVEIKLITGRTHQIRVHLKALNCPILGDPVYGAPSLNQKYNIKRQMLHANNIKFTHPISEVSLELIAPQPKDMKKFIELIQPS